MITTQWERCSLCREFGMDYEQEIRCACCGWAVMTVREPLSEDLLWKLEGMKVKVRVG
jgi:hypothetical protein